MGMGARLLMLVAAVCLTGRCALPGRFQKTKNSGKDTKAVGELLRATGATNAACSRAPVVHRCSASAPAAESPQIWTLGKYWIDPYSSAAWFDGWRDRIRAHEPWQRDLLAEPAPTAAPRVWLLTTGWKRWCLLAFDEVPGRATKTA